jgi:hypothetical protein
MTLAQEIGLIGERILDVSQLNHVENVSNRVDEIFEFLQSSRFDVLLTEAPASEELERCISPAIFSSPHIKNLYLVPRIRVPLQDLLSWIAGRGTLEHMTSLKAIAISVPIGMSALAWDELFRLLTTSTSIQSLVISIRNSFDDALMTALSSYLSENTSLLHLALGEHDTVLSEAASVSLFDAVAESSLLRLILECSISSQANLEKVAEGMAQAIAVSPLEVITVSAQTMKALSLTTPITNVDFAFSTTANTKKCLKINRKWKPLLSANIPLGLWPRILQKAHASPEASHGPEGILFFLLREKADFIPTTPITCLRKRKHADYVGDSSIWRKRNHD